MKKKVLKPKKEMTIDDLAIMVAQGFEQTATKDDIRRLEQQDTEIVKRLDDIDYRLGKIEANHERRIDLLEDKIQIIYTAFEKNLKIKLAK
ncbi:MAG TPA: hypothetical protein VLB02_02825 [Candidatus Paceibacterota bacterium]|nr:hypothetical protein [Candidatus Paceibacterota bacterium]